MRFRRLFLTFVLLLLVVVSALAQKVTINAVNQPAATVFRTLVEQTGKNFVYSSDILEGLTVTVQANNKQLSDVLKKMFSGTGIEYKIKGDNVILRQKKGFEKQVSKSVKPSSSASLSDLKKPSANSFVADDSLMATKLNEVVVVSRLEAPVLETAEIGAKKISLSDLRNTPVILGEPDVIKTLHTQAGVVQGAELVAGMYVHGGNADENLYMLDNVPIYQVNHLGGLFSAFNTDIIRYIDFYKSSVPAKFDGRLSSFMDVRLQNGNSESHHGSARLGLTSGAFNLSGPIGKKTTYLFGIRRSWFDVLSVTMFAIANSQDEDEKNMVHYYFMDLNAKICHNFSPTTNGFVSVYFGDDYLKANSKDSHFYQSMLYDYSSEEKNFLHWGNILVQTGLNHRFNPNLSAEFTAAFTTSYSKYRSSTKYTFNVESETEGLDIDITKPTNEPGSGNNGTDYNGTGYGTGYGTVYGTGKGNGNDASEEYGFDKSELTTKNTIKTENSLHDWIFRGDFDWSANEQNHVRFGASYIRHSFKPESEIRCYDVGQTQIIARDSTWSYGANELNAYIEDDWRMSNNRFRMNAGIHLSLFNIDSKTHYGISPRLSINYRPTEAFAMKAAYTRAVQYVHQLSQSYLSLPTDHWIPIMGKFKPQTADKISLAGYWQSHNEVYNISIEAYYKWMNNLIEYRDEYYLKPPLDMWNAQLCSGRGTAKGLDFKVEKALGKLTGSICYSLAWADRTFALKNGGHTFPAKFDNRHTLQLLLNWKISEKVQFNATWIGHSGNRFTFLTQVWDGPEFIGKDWLNTTSSLREPINYYKLPFYHRLDLGINVKNSRGFWTFSLYNAYNHLNTIAVKQGDKNIKVPNGLTEIETTVPAFKKVKFLPIIPSVSYTWLF